MKKSAPFIIFVVLILVLLEILIKNGVIAAYLIPAPSHILEIFKTENSLLLSATLESSEAALSGLALSLFFGIGAGIVMGLSPFFKKLFYPAAVFFQTVPIIAIAPLLVIWFGYGKVPVMLSSFIVSVFPILSAMVSGIANTEKDLLTLAQLYKASPFRKFLIIQGPSSLPYLAAALRSAVGLAIVGAIVGEFMSGSGLGGVIEVARVQYRVDLVFAALLCVVTLGLIAFLLTDFLEAKVKSRFTNS